MSSHIGWPQGIMLALLAAQILFTAVLDGEPRTGTHKFAVTLCAGAIELGLLYWGGFFS